MLQKGKIIEKDGDFAIAVIKKEGSCADSCASCGMCDSSKLRKVKVLNSDNADLEEEVTLSLESGKIIFLALLTYILPLVIFFLSFLIIDNELLSAALLLLSFFICSAAANLLAKNKSFMTKAKKDSKDADN